MKELETSEDRNSNASKVFPYYTLYYTGIHFQMPKFNLDFFFVIYCVFFALCFRHRDVDDSLATLFKK